MAEILGVARASERDADMQTGTTTSVRRVHRSLWLVALAGLCVGAGGAWWLASSAQSPEQAAARAAEPVASWVTAPVEERVLSATLIERGDVAAEVSVSVEVPVSVEPPAVVTRASVAVGELVSEGDVVVEVSGRPVFVLDGDAAMYRSLAPGMSGDDVMQLQVALGRLGYEPDRDGVFAAATKTAVSAWYADAGYAPVPAFQTADEDIAAAKAAVADAETAVEATQSALKAETAGPSVLEVSQAEVAVQQAQRSLDAAQAQQVTDVRLGEEAYNAAVRARDRLTADPTAAAEADIEAAELEIERARAQLEAARRSTADSVASAAEALWLATIARDDLVDSPDTVEADQALADAVATELAARAALDVVEARNGPTVPFGEAVFVPELPARVQADTASAGSKANNAAAATGLVELSGGSRVVSTSIRPDDAELVRVGMPVDLLDETTATVYSATVTAIADDPVTDSTGQLGLPAVISPDGDLPDSLVGANLRVTITAASTEQATLVVPVAAVSSAADGTTSVSVVADVNTAEPREVAVEAGLSADGFVAITPVAASAISAGDLVVVGR